MTMTKDPAHIPQSVKDEAQRQLEALRRGAVQIYTEDELLGKLARAMHRRRPMRVKLGMDPTTPDIHLGHTVVLGKMRQFQDLGHRAVLIIGDYTARIGDPSGQNHTRPTLSEEQILANAQTYFDQAGKVLDTDRDKLEIRYNSAWLAGLTFADVVRLAAKMTVARMLERDSFEKRHKAGDPIGVHEFLYPLMQGHDSVVVEADVELGGTDQTFNCLAGRELMRDAGLEPQVVVTTPLLVGLDGTEKMSKSKGNCVNVTDAPDQMFGKLMSIPDALMENYWTLLTDEPLESIRKTLRETHPRDAKEALAKRIVERYHDAQAAGAAAEEFRRVFAQKKQPSLIPEKTVYVDGDLSNVGLAGLMVASGCAGSNSDAFRKIKGRAVRCNDTLVTDPHAHIDTTATASTLLQVGKRYWRRLHVKSKDEAPDGEAE